MHIKIKKSEVKKIGVLGAGAWGTALAVLANRAGNNVVLWTRNDEVFSSISHSHTNSIYLPDIFIDPEIIPTMQLEEVCEADVIIFAVPAQHFRSLCIQTPDYLPENIPIIIASKGIERGTGQLMSDIARRILPRNPLAILSGPNFAHEIIAGKPSATTIASDDTDLLKELAFYLRTSYFRPYLSHDMIGVQVAGAIKNVIAIACGIAIGRELGENAKAAILTRGLAEMARLAGAMGGSKKTMMGLSGLGDLSLTCSGSDERTIKSRNTMLGYHIGKGMTISEASLMNKGVKEGFFTSESAKELASHLGIDLPICNATDQVLRYQVSIDEMIESLLSRALNFEEA